MFEICFNKIGTSVYTNLKHQSTFGSHSNAFGKNWTEVTCEFLQYRFENLCKVFYKSKVLCRWQRHQCWILLIVYPDQNRKKHRYIKLFNKSVQFYSTAWIYFYNNFIDSCYLGGLICDKTAQMTYSMCHLIMITNHCKRSFLKVSLYPVSLVVDLLSYCFLPRGKLWSDQKLSHW